MDDPQVKSWFGDRISAILSHPTAQALAARWMQIQTDREPTLADFWHDQDEAIVDQTILILKSASDYIYLHHGRFLRERVGFSMQGRRLRELRTRVRDRLGEIYDRSAAEFEPAYFQSYADFEQEVVLWGRLCLPLRLSDEDERVALLIYCHPIEDKAAIARVMITQSTIGIVVAAPILSDGGALVDGWIIALNDRARDLVGVHHHVSDELTLRHIRLLSRDDVWQHLVSGAEHRARLAVVTDPVGGATLTVAAELIAGYLVIRVTEAEPSQNFVLE